MRMSPLKRAKILKRRRALGGKAMLRRGMRAIIWLTLMRAQSDSMLDCLEWEGLTRTAERGTLQWRGKEKCPRPRSLPAPSSLRSQLRCAREREALFAYKRAQAGLRWQEKRMWCVLQLWWWLQFQNRRELKREEWVGERTHFEALRESPHLNWTLLSAQSPSLKLFGYSAARNLASKYSHYLWTALPHWTAQPAQILLWLILRPEPGSREEHKCRLKLGLLLHRGSWAQDDKTHHSRRHSLNYRRHTHECLQVSLHLRIARHTLLMQWVSSLAASRTRNRWDSQYQGANRSCKWSQTRNTCFESRRLSKYPCQWESSPHNSGLSKASTPSLLRWSSSLQLDTRWRTALLSRSSQVRRCCTKLRHCTLHSAQDTLRWERRLTLAFPSLAEVGSGTAAETVGRLSIRVVYHLIVEQGARETIRVKRALARGTLRRTLLARLSFQVIVTRVVLASSHTGRSSLNTIVAIWARTASTIGGTCTGAAEEIAGGTRAAVQE